MSGLGFAYCDFVGATVPAPVILPAAPRPAQGLDNARRRRGCQRASRRPPPRCRRRRLRSWSDRIAEARKKAAGGARVRGQARPGDRSTRFEPFRCWARPGNPLSQDFFDCWMRGSPPASTPIVISPEDVVALQGGSLPLESLMSPSEVPSMRQRWIMRPSARTIQRFPWSAGEPSSP